MVRELHACTVTDGAAAVADNKVTAAAGFAGAAVMRPTTGRSQPIYVCRYYPVAAAYTLPRCDKRKRRRRLVGQRTGRTCADNR